MRDFSQTRMLKFCNGFWFLLILAAMVMIAIVLNRWETYSHNWVALTVYLAVPVMLIGTSLCILKLVAPVRRLNLTLVAASVLVATYSTEIFLEYWDSVGVRSIKAFASGVKFDHRSKKEVIEQLRSEGKQAYPTILPTNLLEKSVPNKLHSIITIDNQEVLPLSGIASVTTVYNVESGQWVVYKSDIYGFRNPTEIWNYKQYDLAVIGDSNVHGAGLLDGEDPVSLLRAHFPTAVNLGMSGNGPLMVFATIREYCRKLRPRFVVYFYFEGNDLIDLSRDKKAALLMRYLQEESWSQNLHKRQDAVNAALLDIGEKKFQKLDKERLVRLRQIFGLSNLRTRISLDLATRTSELQPDLVLFETILNRMRHEVKAWGGTFVFAYLPAWERFMDPNYSQYRKEVLDIVKKLRVPLVDLYPIFQEQVDVFELYHFGLNGHYNPSGAKLLANAISTKLNSFPRHEHEYSHVPNQNASIDIEKRVSTGRIN